MEDAGQGRTDPDPTIDTSAQAFERYLGEDDDGRPVLIMNLLRFNPGGRALYQEYLRQVSVLMADAGGEVFFAGDFSSPLIPGTPSDWDAMVLARYPDREGLFTVSRDPRFPAINELRHEALATTFVQALSGW